MPLYVVWNHNICYRLSILYSYRAGRCEPIVQELTCGSPVARNASHPPSSVTDIGHCGYNTDVEVQNLISVVKRKAEREPYGPSICSGCKIKPL